MSRDHFSAAEKQGCAEIIRRYNYAISSECGDECRLHLGRYVSDRTLRDWTHTLLAPKPRRNASAPLPTILPTSAETGSTDAGALPEIDLSGLSRVEVLDLAIDRRLAALVKSAQATGDSSLSKIVAELMEARRRELGIPMAVMDALSQLGRLQGIVQRSIERGDLPLSETLKTYLASLCDGLEANGIERPTITLEWPAAIQPLALSAPNGNGDVGDDDGAIA
jgi:hypothetical protein